jgi:Protein of unknown function (DUF3365)
MRKPAKEETDMKYLDLRRACARLGLLAGFFMLFGCGSKPGTQGIPPEKVAELIHQVLEADRTVYTKEVVNRLQLDEEVIKASEHFKEDKALPLPAQMLRMGAQLVAEKGVFRYALISKWAINKANLPKSDFEAKGLEAVVADPSKPYVETITAGGKKYFAALYADKAVAPACVTCHNGHKESPKTDFKLGDVMGGVVISIPLES